MRKHLLLPIVCASLLLVLSACANGVKKEPASIAAMTPFPTPTPVPVSVLLADALKHYEAGNYEEAILVYTSVIEIEPKNMAAHLGLGKTYMDSGQSAEAVSALRKAREIDPYNMDASYYLMAARLNTGAYGEAEKVARERLRINASDWEARLVLLCAQEMQEKGEGDIMMTLASPDWKEIVRNTTQAPTQIDPAFSGFGKRYYPNEGFYLGGYMKGLRSGIGVWIVTGGQDEGEAHDIFFGEWANDKPNGKGTYYTYYNNNYQWNEGYFIDGVGEGEFILGGYSAGCGMWNYKFLLHDGIPQSMGIADSNAIGLDPGEEIMAQYSNDKTNWVPYCHYFAGLHCKDCVGSKGVPLTASGDWLAGLHPWAGWGENVRTFCVPGFYETTQDNSRGEEEMHSETY